jgi:agmatine deiminase
MRLAFPGRLIAAALICLATAGTALADAEAQRWRAAEAQAHGRFDRLLALVHSAPVRPQLRLQRSADELNTALEAAGRWAALGITPSQGRELVLAYYRRQGLTPDGRRAGAAPPAAPSNATPVAPAIAPAIAPTVPDERWRAGREFDRLDGVLLRWPFDWSALRDEYVVMVRTIVAAGATPTIWVDNTRQQRSAQLLLRRAGVDTRQVQWRVENTDSVWIRDYGPIYLYGPDDTGAPDWAMVDFHYYDGRPNDDDTPRQVALPAGKAVVDRETTQRVYTEGGNINTDGLGAVLYSTRTYSRNPAMPRATIDQRIASALNATRPLVLQDPSLDGTGHVDMFSKIIGPATVLVGQYDADETDHAVLEANATALAAAVDGAGRPWNVVRIRQPDVYFEGVVNPVVRTYTNSLIVNDHVIVPTYGIDDDGPALALYQQLFPGRTIVPLDARQIIPSAGAWHCVTMEFPAPGL